jgi:glycine dehydrogenase
MNFADRHIGPAAQQRQRMLGAVGYGSLDELSTAALPAQIAADRELSLAAPLSEGQALAELRRLAGRNEVLTSMIGLGYYDTVTPPVIRRNVLESPAWYTAYTPYQPEISQGRLEALLNFQTMVADLTALPVAGASMLDEATAAAEAMTLARRVTGRGRVFLADADCLPQTLAVLATRAEPLGVELVVAPVTPALIAAQPDGELFGVLLQYPAASGAVTDPRPAIEAAHAHGAQVAVAADLLALTLLTPPGELGADIAVGTTQRFGVPMGYGGPHAGYICVRDGLKRQLPGRLVGVSVDADGQPAYRLALQAREQHIRREKATSNICTAQVLLAVIAGMYAVYHGPEGLTAIARRVHSRAVTLSAALTDLGFITGPAPVFDTVALIAPGQAAELAGRARAAGYNVHEPGPDALQISCDETTTPEQLREVLSALAGRDVELPAEPAAGGPALPPGLARTSPFLTHPVFSAHRSETAMLRYLRRLSDLDIALDRSMIPLGSCTMKLNAAAEMEAITWPEFAGLHPFAPPEQAAGYLELIAGLERMLQEITGYEVVSLQPNAGSQGELAGLLAIRGYHRSNGQPQRTVCLIPESAHGTNAASAVLAGLRVVVVKCGGDGVIDLSDLRAKLAAHEGAIAAIMLTYPSTNGVFEETIGQVRDEVHTAGGQVYVDGANLNALVGLARLGDFGDVSHLNLHKTFCIPHGGGGPGVGPVAVRGHLAPFLPGHPRAVRVGRDPAHLLGLHRDDGRRRTAPGYPGRDPGGELRGHAAEPAFPGALYRTRRAGRARVHPGPAPDRRADRRDRRGCRQAAHRLRVSRANHVLPGGGHAHGRADGERGPDRAGQVLRRHDRHPAGDRPRRLRRLRPAGQPAQERSAHGEHADQRRLEARLRPTVCGLPAGHRPAVEVLAARPADRPGLRRPEPDVRLPPARGVRVIARSVVSRCPRLGFRAGGVRVPRGGLGVPVWVPGPGHSGFARYRTGRLPLPSAGTAPPTRARPGGPR